MKSNTSNSNPQFFYQLRGTLYRNVNNPQDLIEINEIFESDDPIDARERVFSAYQNLVDVLLQSKDQEYTSHELTLENLKDFIQRNNFNKEEFNELLSLNNTLFNTENDFDKGLCVYLVYSNSKSFTTVEGDLIYEEKLLLHDLNSQINGLRDVMFDNLLIEYKLYEKYEYNYKDYVTTYPKTTNLDPINAVNYILETPLIYSFDYLLKNI